MAQAEAEGLTLQKSDNNSGYKGIRKRSSHTRKKLYEATETLGGKTKSRARSSVSVRATCSVLFRLFRRLRV